MPSIVPFKQEHLDKINLLFEFSQSAKNNYKNPDELLGYTGIENNAVLACGGVHKLWKGVGEAWLMIGREGYERPKVVAKYTQYIFQHLLEDNDLFRIQASVSAIDTRAIRYAEWLGFEKEGIMKKYGPDGSDYIRYARVV